MSFKNVLFLTKTLSADFTSVDSQIAIEYHLKLYVMDATILFSTRNFFCLYNIDIVILQLQVLSVADFFYLDLRRSNFFF